MHLSAIVLFGALLLCFQSLSHADQKTAQPIYENETECTQHGGTWAKFGMLGVEQCDLPTRDAGKRCHDSDECETFCEAPEDAQPGEPVTGKCYGRTLSLGKCLKRVEKGLGTPGLCVD